jgi:hypothetical protein
VIRCKDCNWMGYEEEELVEIDDSITTEFWGVVQTTHSSHRCCPKCESDDIDYNYVPEEDMEEAE